MKISVVSGGFDPLHSGHLDYFIEAKKISGYLIVLLNSDQWLKDKKGKAYEFYGTCQDITTRINNQKEYQQ